MTDLEHVLGRPWRRNELHLLYPWMYVLICRKQWRSYRHYTTGQPCEPSCNTAANLWQAIKHDQISQVTLSTDHHVDISSGNGLMSMAKWVWPDEDDLMKMAWWAWPGEYGLVRTTSCRWPGEVGREGTQDPTRWVNRIIHPKFDGLHYEIQIVVHSRLWMKMTICPDDRHWTTWSLAKSYSAHARENVGTHWFPPHLTIALIHL